MAELLLFHTGFSEIPVPDVHYGRVNADFGQGFYLSDNEEFSCRWARERKGEDTILNSYELETDGLTIHCFERDGDWFDYIYANRQSRPDSLPEADVIIGPIANDTIYETFGIFTSGFLSRELALQLLQLGPAYVQVVLKTEKAVRQLKWLGARILPAEEIGKYREVVAKEQEAYQTAFAAELSKHAE